LFEPENVAFVAICITLRKGVEAGSSFVVVIQARLRVSSRGRQTRARTVPESGITISNFLRQRLSVGPQVLFCRRNGKLLKLPLRNDWIDKTPKRLDRLRVVVGGMRLNAHFKHSIRVKPRNIDRPIFNYLICSGNTIPMLFFVNEPSVTPPFNGLHDNTVPANNWLNPHVGKRQFVGTVQYVVAYPSGLHARVPPAGLGYSSHSLVAETASYSSCKGRRVVGRIPQPLAREKLNRHV